MSATDTTSSPDGGQGEPDPTSPDAFRSTIITSIGGAITILLGAAIAVASAVGEEVSDTVTIGAMALAGVGVVMVGVVISVDLRCRTAITIAEISHGPLTDAERGAVAVQAPPSTN